MDMLRIVLVGAVVALVLAFVYRGEIVQKFNSTFMD
jgi:hypothetical protein